MTARLRAHRVTGRRTHLTTQHDPVPGGGLNPPGPLTHTIHDVRRSTTMNALIYEQIARERHREAHSEARRLRQARALRARRRVFSRRASR